MNTILKKIWSEFIYGGHFLASGDALTLYVLGAILNIHVTWDFMLIIYLCVFSANLYNREEESETDELTNPMRVRVMKKYVDNQKFIIPISLAIVSALFLYFANWNVLIFAGIIFSISILYSVFLKALTEKIIGFKSIIAAFFYGLMVFLLVSYYKTPQIDLAVILVFIFYYIRIYISNAYCDFKDIMGDQKRGLKTIAVYFGEKKAIKILNFLNFASAVPIVAGVYFGIIPVFSLAILLTIFYAMCYFYLNKKVTKEVLSNVIIDGEFIPWLLYILLGKSQL